MAKAEISGLPIKPVEPVVLTLNKEEAQVLADVTSMVGGMQATSRRELTDDIMRALSSVGYRYNAAAYGKDGDLFGCKVHFKDRK